MRILFNFFGFFSLSVGLIGVFLPLLPTVPFVLLAAFCFSKGSPAIYAWLLAHPWIGGVLKEYTRNRRISGRTLAWALSLLWISILASAVLWNGEFWLYAVLLGIGVGVTCHLRRLSA